MGIVQELIAELESTRSVSSDLEPIDPLAHALQCAGHALTAGADDELVVACAFHDIGISPRLRARYGSIGHEAAGYFFLLEHFSVRVAWLVGAHVDALRYLAARDPRYQELLSAGSARVLLNSGGPLVGANYEAFDYHPWRTEALALREWDEAAKDPYAESPSISEIVSAVAHVVHT
jgi:gamma-butyrobetaine dioxygenase